MVTLIVKMASACNCAPVCVRLDKKRNGGTQGGDGSLG